jgi:hypothetical protein
MLRADVGSCWPAAPAERKAKKVKKIQEFKVRYRAGKIELKITESAETGTGKGKKRKMTEGEPHTALHHELKLEDLMRGRSVTHNLAAYSQTLGDLQGSKHATDRERGRRLYDRVEPLIKRARLAAERADTVGGAEVESEAVGQSASDIRAATPLRTTGWPEVDICNANRAIVLALSRTMNGAVWEPNRGHAAATDPTGHAAATEPGPCFQLMCTLRSAC